MMIIHSHRSQRDMGSLELEEERLWQMVHDFIESEPSSTTTTSHFHQHYSIPKQTSNSPLSHSQSRSFTLQEILGDETEAEAQIEERVRIHMRKRMEMEKSTSLKRWLATCLTSDGFDASLCFTSWVSSPGCPSGNYEYIDIKGGRRVIVDIDFKSQFEVARPTKSYTELSRNLPTMFVGREEKLRQVVRLVCIAAEDSMKERGLHIPPWRKYAYMHSKWLSITCTREEPRDEVAPNPKRDPPAHMLRPKPKPKPKPKSIRRDMGSATAALSGSALSTHFANMGIIY